MTRALAAWLVLPLLLAPAACGGSPKPAATTGSSPSPSIVVPGLISASGAVPAGYLAEVDAACATSLAELRKRGPAPVAPSDPSRLTARQLRAAAPYLRRGADIERAGAAAVARFAPPPSGADLWAVYRTAVAQYAAGIATEAGAAGTGDVPRFLAAAQRLLALRTKVLESGLAVGLGAGTACARLF